MTKIENIKEIIFLYCITMSCESEGVKSWLNEWNCTTETECDESIKEQ
jgi:hypothetical protein